MKTTIFFLLLTLIPEFYRESTPPINVRQTVSLLGQDKSNACWIASTAMMLSWKKKKNVSITAALAELDGGPTGKFRNVYNANKGLLLTDLGKLTNKAGLKAEPPASYSIQFYREELAKSPLLVIYAVSSQIAHAVVIYGIEGDGSPSGTYLLVNDPWPKTGSPSKTNNKGRLLRLNMYQFTEYYENLVNALPLEGDLIAQVYHF